MRFANSVTQKFVDVGIIKYKDKELYAYGLWQGIALLYNFATIMILALIFKMFWQSMIFMIAYSLIRPYAGGYHARTPLKCYLFSVVIIIAVLWLIKYIPWNSFICFIMITVASIIIFILSPVEDKNKPLDKIEQVVFKKRTNILLSILVGLAIFLLLVGLESISIYIGIALAVLAAMLILGKIKNLIGGKKVCLK